MGNCIDVGKSLKCSSNIPTGGSTSSVYRYMGNKILRGYPNETIAISWEPNYYNPGGVLENMDCAVFTVGANMAVKPTVDVGKSVKCTSNIPTARTGDTIYRWDGSNLRPYPSETIAISWEPNYYNPGGVLDIDCAGFTVGTDMAINPATQYRYLCNEHNKCLTDSSGSAIQYSISTYWGDKQKWKFDGKHICNPNNKCLAAASNSSGWGGQYVLWDKKEEQGQKWTLGDNKSLCNEHNGCMGSPENTQLEGANLIQWGFVDQKGQKWSWKES